MKRATDLFVPSNCTRREMLLRSGAGFGALALSYLLRDDPLFAGAPHNPAATRPSHFAARAKSVIFLFMEGGPSHLDLFDPKPLLNELAGKPIPPSFGRVITAMGEFDSPISRPGKYRARILSAVAPDRASRADPITHRPTPWPDPRPLRR